MKRFPLYIAIIALGAVLLSCTKDHDGFDIPPAGEELSVKFTMQLPRSSDEATRAMTVDEESQISTVDVLAFVKDSNGDYRYTYTATYVSKSENGNDVIVTAKVKAYEAEQQFVVLVNASSELSSAGIIRSEELSSAVAKIVCTAGGGEWPARNNGTGTFKPIPMYAKTAAQIITPTSSTIGTYPMIRMIARIDVSLASTVTNFKLVNASLFNYKKAGYVAHDFSNMSGSTAQTPAVPTTGDHTGTPILEPTVFHLADYTDDAKGRITRSVYTFESPAITTEAGKIIGTALVIGGYYGSNTTDLVYYRVDLKTTVDISQNISSGILRNHHYKVEIQSVEDPGHESALEAYKGNKPIVFTVSVTPWGENVNVELPFKLPEIPGAGTSLSSKTYVGAFWKASEKGERVIRIAPTAGAGKWAVQVYDYGRHFSPGDILFSTEDSGSDQYLYTDNPRDPESYPVTGNIFAENSTVEEGGKHYIKFRIGLKGTYTATKTAPARYAVAMIAYTPVNGTTIYQKLFLRQGEGADYVMAPGDKQSDGTAFPGGRGDVKPWSPYNLTVKTWANNEYSQIQKRDFTNGGYVAGTGDSESDFVAYPTMAGAHLQWGPEETGTAWHRQAFNPGLASVTSWYEYTSPTWSDELHETCPEGYRRPISKEQSGGIAGNEALQSLVSTKENENNNSAWGYYADGYFDRLQVQDANGTFPAESSAVARGGKDAAYIGQIIFNDSPSSATHYNASLFIPASGFRYNIGGALYYAGSQGNIWSRLTNSSNPDFGYYISLANGVLGLYTSYPKTGGFTVRCVADENWTPAGGTLTAELKAQTGATVTPEGGTITSDSPTSPAYDINVSSDVPWIAEVHRQTDAVTHGDLSLLGKPLLRHDNGFGGVSPKQIFERLTSDSQGRYDWKVTIIPASYSKDATGTLEIVFRNANTGDVLHYMFIDVVQAPFTTTAAPAHNYVGAFWRADQKGERLLLLNVPGAVGSAWKVEVDDYGDFAEGDILFSLAPSDDTNVYTSGTADMIVNDAIYKVNTNLTSIRSMQTTANAGIPIRVGLRARWTPSAAKPARYARLKFTWDNGAGSRYIYLRQGHDADYLMRKQDGTDNGVLASRPLAMPFSPYNLTSPIYRADGGASDNTSDVLNYRGGVMTEYPSQAGTFFQWANTTSGTRAFHPTNPVNDRDPDFGTIEDVTTWWDDNLESIYETCPNGYRRPTDGPTDNYYTNTTPAVSEIAQSLWIDPQNNSVTDASNSVWGYYADGFFDRREITNQENSPALGSTETTGTAVATNTSNVAYIGQLFYNRFNNASLFFPASGGRYFQNGSSNINFGKLTSAGRIGIYWSSSSQAATKAWVTYLANNNAARYHYDRSYGYSVRCVKK